MLIIAVMRWMLVDKQIESPIYMVEQEIAHIYLLITPSSFQRRRFYNILPYANIRDESYSFNGTDPEIPNLLATVNT